MALKILRIESDKNADWIKTGKGHSLEAQIHEELARRYKTNRAKKPNRQDGEADENEVKQ